MRTSLQKRLLLLAVMISFFPQASFGQIPTLDQQHLNSNQPQPLCLDFNQDKVCESLLLANGTMIKNPNDPKSASVKTDPRAEEVEEEAETNQEGGSGNPEFFNLNVKGYDVNKKYEVCHGTYSGARECQELNGKQLDTPIKFALASTFDMTIYACARDLSTQAIACEYFDNTPKNPENITVTAISKIPPLTVRDPVVVEDEEAVVEDEEAEGSDEGDAGRPPSDNPYCDVVRQTGGSYDSCFDRKDYSESTGLYPCRDGSDVEDWRDCPDGPEANSDSDSNDDEGDEGSDSSDLPQEGGCQGEDDYCDADEGCRSDDVDCIDDRGFDEDDYNG